jgi:hypothetical protein
LHAWHSSWLQQALSCRLLRLCRPCSCRRCRHSARSEWPVVGPRACVCMVWCMCAGCEYCSLWLMPLLCTHSSCMDRSSLCSMCSND